MRNRFFHWQDLFLILFCLSIAGIFLLWSAQKPSGGIAVIEQNGAEIGRYDLSLQQETKIITVPGDISVTICIAPGEAYFQDAQCPDQVCVRTGKLTKPGQSAVCLPARVSLRILTSSEKPNAYDGITG